MLLAVLIDREALEVDVSPGTELGLHGSGDVDGGLETQFRHPVLHNLEVDGDDAGHLNGTAEADLSIALGEVEVADRELRPWHVDGQVDLAATTQILDTVFRGQRLLIPQCRVFFFIEVTYSQLPPCSGLPGIVRAPSLPTFSLIAASAEPASVTPCEHCGRLETRTDSGIPRQARRFINCERTGDKDLEILTSPCRLRGHCNISFELAGSNEFALTLIPGLEDLGRRGAAEDSWVDEAGEFDVGNVPRGTVYAFKIPDSLRTVREISR